MQPIQLNDPERVTATWQIWTQICHENGQISTWDSYKVKVPIIQVTSLHSVQEIIRSITNELQMHAIMSLNDHRSFYVDQYTI